MCSLIATILIIQNPSTGYEISVYSAMPAMIWILFSVAITGGIAIVVYQVTAGHERKGGDWWQIGLLLILLNSVVIILLPYLRGYAFSGPGDHLYHLGSVKDIIWTGSTTLGNIYPITHILISQFSSILNISPEIMINFIGPLFYLLFVLFTYLLSKPSPAPVPYIIRSLSINREPNFVI